MTKRSESNRRTVGRIPNKVKWNLEDARVLLLEAYPHWQAAMARAEAHKDAELAFSLARLRDLLARVERKVVDAQAGDYQEGGDD